MTPLLHSHTMTRTGLFMLTITTLATRCRQPLLLLLALLLSTAALAQDDTAPEAPQWYQVEVFIFANDSPYAGGTELWPEDVSLSYPARIVSLSEPSAETGVSPLASADTTSAEAALQEQPYVVLAPEAMKLREVAARVLRQHDFRTLFHKAWRQPAASRDEANSILVRGGDSFDDHRELEGWVQLSVERYLHFRTDLWLSTFKSTAGLDQMPWPKLPRLPVTSTPRAPAGFAGTDDDFGGLLSAEYGAALPALDFGHRRYVVDRTVVLRQSRRMRSGELHYIDHPLMGILVRVTPYEPPLAPVGDATDDRAANAETAPSAQPDSD